MGSDTNYDNLPVAAPGETVEVRPPGISPRLGAAGPSLPENGRRLAKKGALDLLVEVSGNVARRALCEPKPRPFSSPLGSIQVGRTSTVSPVHAGIRGQPG